AAPPASAFLSAARHLCELARVIPVSRLDDAATDAWSVRELLAHAVRGMGTVQVTLETPVDASTPALGSASDYFARAMSTPMVHEGIVARARDAADAVGGDPRGYAADAFERVESLVASTPADREVQHFAGRLSFGEYLRTRVVELTLHAVD